MHEVKLPQLGQSVEEASIIQWYKREGDAVALGENLYSIQTDKAEIDVESPAAGILRRIVVDTDITVPVLTVVALIGTADEPLPELAAPKAQTAAPVPAPAAAPAQPATPVAQQQATPASTGGHAAVSPRARKKAAELGVDPEDAVGSGPQGRVLEADVLGLRPVKATPTARALAQLEGVRLGKVGGTGPQGKVMKADVERAAQAPAVSAIAPGEVRRVPLSPMRRIIAQRMCESVYSAPHYFITVEVDMAAAKAFRAGFTEAKVSFNDLVLRGVTLALQQWPQVNARWAGDAIEEVGDINLGMAVALPAGLIVPVVRRCQDKSLVEISRECRELAEKARTGKLLPADYSENTFTVSNLGGLGVDSFTAIINQPDSAILAVGQIKDRPVVIDGGIHIRPIMNLTLSSDHRVIDGAVAAQFMSTLKTTLESAEF